MAVPTIRQIADACGYNNATVSRALSCKANVAPKTREHILKVAQEMGWKPNPLASIYMAHLRSTQTPEYRATLAYLVSHGGIRKYDDLPGFIQLCYQGAKRRAAALGYSLDIVWLHEADYNFQVLSRQMRSRGIPGVVFSLHDNTYSLKDFDWDSFAVSAVGYDQSFPHLHRAAFYWPLGIRMALKKIREAGYRRAALVIPEIYDRKTDYILTSTFRYEGPVVAPGLTCLTHVFRNETPGDLVKVQQWIRAKKPEVVMGAYPLWDLLAKMKWSVPGDVAYVSPHWSSSASDIAGIDQCPELIGANAIDLVSTQLLYNERGLPKTPQMILNEGRWMAGASLPVRALTA